MSSDADSPRQRTVAELLAAHGGDTAVTGRRARRRASEDAGDVGQTVTEASVGSVGRPQPTANGNAPYANGAGAAPYRNGSPDASPAVPGNGAPNAYGPPPVQAGDGYTNGASDHRNPHGAPAQPGNETYGNPYGNGAGAPAQPGNENYANPYANGAGAPAPPGNENYANPYANLAGAPAPPGNRGPYGNGNGNGTTGPDPRPAPPTPRRSASRSGDLGAMVPYPDGDAPFVNGGAVYADTATTSYGGATPWTADRSVLREPVPVEDAAPAAADPTHRTGEPWSPPSADQARSRPTEQMPRMRSDNTPMLDPGLTGPIDMQRLPQADDADGGPSTAVGMAPAGAEVWHREGTGRRGNRRTDRRADTDGGPPTAASAPFDNDEYDGDEYDGDEYDGDEYDGDPLSGAPAGLSAEPGRRRTSPVVDGAAGHTWAAVVAQWIAGAIGGATLWVGFRFLWRDLPVVALAAAALVTVGLVLVVRALMRNDDRRTTIFAVLVGLLLTVSPAILVLLGR